MDRGIEGKNRCNDHIRAGGSIAIYERSASLSGSVTHLKPSSQSLSLPLSLSGSGLTSSRKCIRSAWLAVALWGGR